MTPAILLPLPLYALITALNWVVPGRWVDGYVVDKATGKKLRYHLNGLRVFLLTVGLWAAACALGWLPWDALYVHRWETLAGAFTLGITFTLVIVLRAPPVPGSNLLRDLFLGRLENPQLGGGRIDAKMWLYLVGATTLELNILSFVAAHVQAHPADPSPGVFLYAALFSFFLMEYLWFEEVHLYTYDFMAERVGFKLGWGCLVFYPFFYSVGLWFLALAPNPHTPAPLLVLTALLFFTGWCLSRGANLQKFNFKRDPTRVVFGVLKPEALATEDGKLVLVSGFWGLSRHINYLGEVCMASGLALSLGYPLHWAPWLYPLYYVALLVPRQFDDDRRCAQRYGSAWAEYCRRVPSRIIPRVF